MYGGWAGRVVYVETGKVYAIRMVDVSLLNEHNLADIQMRLDILRKIKHRNIIRLHAYFKEENRLYLVTELYVQ